MCESKVRDNEAAGKDSFPSEGKPEWEGEKSTPWAVEANWALWRKAGEPKMKFILLYTALCLFL